ncbi:PREDICTED: probable inactive serine/threonine-protein kinase fnkC [Tarenaya hassleriana]|uniref:probable inactive serine/threonine-protein kinase fnkC n=1 Tax=Tarenaya hassleriana TaxID=28532 RepID=UPI00053C6C35|nr:PREDICTED: probable inactive serine/threonine-protein kinase fnkC [Tarenaya hassleriana]
MASDSKLQSEPSVSRTARYWSHRPPSTYCLKIESFEELQNSDSTEKYESCPFTAGGYNWTLILYPNGNKRENGTGYISLYVAIDISCFKTAPREVYADLNFFIYNKKENKYLTIQVGTEVQCFYMLRTVQGFSQVLAIDNFSDPANGYLYDGGHCEFGVDVFTTPPFHQCEVFSVTKKFDSPKFTWRVKNFSTLSKDVNKSEAFSMGKRSWVLDLYPRGTGSGKGNWVSLFVELGRNEVLKPGEKVYARYKLRVLDQKQSNHKESTAEYWFEKPNYDWGYPQFVSLSDLRDSSKGFIMNDELVVEVEFEALSETNYFSSNTE